MNITKLIAAMAVSASLALGVAAQAREKKHEEEGADFEAVIEKGGKEWGVKIDASGKVVGKHDESREKGEKAEKE